MYQYRRSSSESSSPERAEPPPNLCLPTPSIAAMESQHCIKILVATDNHIGYAESDPIRGQDSINTFREILQLATENDVDMLLLAGDLFHENRPSRASLYSTIASLREFCLNSRPVQIELIGDTGMGIPHSFNFPPVNYEDENINVGLPVFSIHGNHDDPQGVGPEGALCALDVLSASGLINYFGRQELPGAAQTDEQASEQGLHIQPVLLQKGRTRLAMYGIGNIRDERFHYEMRSNRIRMSRPAEFRDEWFNLMLVHQNRVAHGHQNSVPENGFGDDVDLLIWGHEHDCLIQPHEVPGKGYFISQPGSSVATSLAKGESLKKHVAILEIQDRDFSMIPIPLKTVRPFIFHEIILSEEEEEHHLKLDDKPKVVKYLKKLVEEMIKQANSEWDMAHTDNANAPSRMLPLIRLRVEFTRPDGLTAYEVGNPQRFGQDFLGQVANPKDVVQFYRKRKISSRKPKNEIDLPEDDVIIDSQGRATRAEKVEVSTLVHQYLEAQNLGVLAENGMQRAVSLFVEKDDRDAIKEFYTNALKATQAHVKGSASKTLDIQDRSTSKGDESEEDALLEQLTRAKEVYAEEWEQEQEREFGRTREKSHGKTAGNRRRGDDETDDSDCGRTPIARNDPESNTESDGASIPVSKLKGQKSTTSKAPARNLFNAPSDSDASSQVSNTFITSTKKSAPAKKPPVKKAPAKKAAGSTRRKANESQTQTTLNFSQGPPIRNARTRNQTAGSQAAANPQDDSDTIEESEDDHRTSRRRTANGVRSRG
ncbi:hypothetical protein O181_020368 [Austropuccinia psidii MF-1]|uniref:Double-strand break repair protein n=1 Tax=Austropuccinia psidii MF-1 TaxID=1389203 RepID=A0A9Q3GUG0_9BASI|nr:hypothetical protein [Austropuccinia psidii MF-1]